MTKPAIIDFDSEFDIDSDEPVHTKQFKMFGQEWTLVCDINSFGISELTTGDAAGLVRFIQGLIQPDQWSEFSQKLGQVRNLNGEKLGKILNKMIEVASGLPTTPLSPSPRGASKRTSNPKSAANSSSARVVRSTH